MYETKMHEINQQMAALTDAKLNLAEKINNMKQKWEDGKE
jgi:MerR family transcriptional regulator, Zn(II)-responsive regulator of zntA